MSTLGLNIAFRPNSIHIYFRRLDNGTHYPLLSNAKSIRIYLQTFWTSGAPDPRQISNPIFSWSGVTLSHVSALVLVFACSVWVSSIWRRCACGSVYLVWPSGTISCIWWCGYAFFVAASSILCGMRCGMAWRHYDDGDK